jgi:predicted regulator of Ras-like GTPase activity (Roadblock/LC7/MglB family)
VAFLRILDELLTSTDGSIAALFLDYEGETVELLCHGDLAKDDLKIIGAYQGIFLMQLKRVCTGLDVGEPQRFKIEFAKTKVLSCDLRDGYYVVLVMDSAANEGVAWHRLASCREALIAEM